VATGRSQPSRGASGVSSAAVGRRSRGARVVVLEPAGSAEALAISEAAVGETGKAGRARTAPSRRGSATVELLTALAETLGGGGSTGAGGTAASARSISTAVTRSAACSPPAAP
jgi:hypothetical protein